jgi:hypothetical protein
MSRPLATGSRTRRYYRWIPLLALTALVLPGIGASAVPNAGTVSPLTPTARWSGGPFFTSNPAGCLPVIDPSCDSYALTISPPATGNSTVDIVVSTANGADDDFDVFVYSPSGARVGSSTNGGTPPEKVTLDNPVAGTYTVQVQAWLVNPGATYNAVATLTSSTSVANDTSSVLWNFDKNAAQASADVPLRVVMVGFKPGEVDEAAVLGQIPTSQRPGVLIPHADSGGGGCDNEGFFVEGTATLMNHGRCYYEGSKPFLVPTQYNWKPKLIYAPDSFADGLFAHMRANSTTGEASGSSYRPYLEKYNAQRGVFRGADNQVTPGTPIRFVDGEATEQWLADNSMSALGFDLGPRGGNTIGPGKVPGYTVFVLNTWDSAQAKARLAPQHEYHVFKINRIDPDTHEFAGIDWARVWGGKHRELILDLGAAPNPYESETWGNRNRTVNGSDSYDPPLWEYRANAPRPFVPGDLADPERSDQAISPGATWDRNALNYDLARFTVEAASFRFFHSYLYEPRPQVGRYWLSSNIWHDLKAEAVWPTDLTKLYDQNAVLSGLRTLVPYFTFDGDVRYEYLSEGGADYTADQANLDQAKADGDDVAGAPFDAMHTQTSMDYLDAHPDRFHRGGDCFTTVPNLEVTVEGHYAWALPVIVAGIATNNAGVPWGFLASVNDATKWSGSDDQDAVLHPVHPDAFSGTFTYTSIHELSHYLGLAHPHDTIGAWKRSDGTTQYWDGFTWTFNTTAAPTTYSHDELEYSILDQENIAQGHTAYYLTWTNEALAAGGQAYYDRGITLVKQLPADVQRLRKAALTSMVAARAAFAKFDVIAASFAAQKAWHAAAAYRDIALGLAPGSTELEKGTLSSGASACTSAKH